MRPACRATAGAAAVHDGTFISAAETDAALVRALLLLLLPALLLLATHRALQLCLTNPQSNQNPDHLPLGFLIIWF